MTLGERICALRTRKNLSQGELAESLDVSRQSISKWETNASVPELDKLIKLSEIFEVSLDELILDKKAAEKAAEPEPKIVYVERQATGANGKTAGLVLLCFAALVWLMCTLLGGFLEGLVFAAPFAGCGLICLYIRKYPGLWCGWVAYLFIDLYLRFATGVNGLFVFMPHVYAGGWTLQLIVAWCMFAVGAALTVLTALLTHKAFPGSLRGDLIGAISGWVVYAVTWFVFALPAYEAQEAVAYRQIYRYMSAVCGWVRGLVLVVALIFSIRLIKFLLEKRKGK